MLGDHQPLDYRDDEENDKVHSQIIHLKMENYREDRVQMPVPRPVEKLPSSKEKRLECLIILGMPYL